MRKASTLGVVSAGLLLAGSPAQAVDTNMSSNLNVGIANGIQAHLPVQAPINVCGNAIGLLGSATASCVGGAKANYMSGDDHHHGGHNGYGGHNGGGHGGPRGGDSNLSSNLNVGIANGIQADALVQVPVNICGNAIGILGSATASCYKSGATANAFSGGHQSTHRHRPPMPYSTPRTIAPRPAVNKAVNKALPNNIRTVATPKKKEQGLLANVLSPVTGLLGLGGNGNGNGGHGHDDKCGDVRMSTFGNVGIANGIQAHAPIQIPVNFAGNGIALLGSASGSSVGGATANYCS